MPYNLPPPPNYAGAGGVAYEPLEGDSLTRFIRSFANYLASAGQTGYGYGQGLVAGGAEGLAGAAATAQPSADYWTRILTGNRPEMMNVLAPEIGRIASGYQQAGKAASMFAPRGGGRTAFMGELPFAQSRDVSNLFSTLRPQAATGVTQNAALQGQIAQALGSLGLSQSSLGQNLMQLLGNIQLTRRGQNVQEHGQALGLAGDLGRALIGGTSSVIGAGMRP